jgi:potassium/hydrogen antiporter
VALACILFDGGMNIGRARFRSAASAIALTGVLGTFLTVIAAALLVHFAFGLAWFVALLVATAVAPTDPAVVFSVLGQREVSGRAGIIVKGEAGANDPVGIALMVSLIAAAGVSAGAFAQVGGEFLVGVLFLRRRLGARFWPTARTGWRRSRRWRRWTTAGSRGPG